MQKNKCLIILTIFLLLLISSSFAWLNLAKSSEKINILKAGNLSLILDETETEGISIEKAIPISDRQGLTQEGYIFKLVNNGKNSSNYTIYLDDLALEEYETRMPDSVVKYNLTKNGVEGSSNLLTSIGTNPKRIVDTGTIEGNTTNTYTLKVWMDSEATVDVMNTVFFAKLRVEAEQVSIKVEESDMTIDITDTTQKLDLEEDISNYTIESSDPSIATIDNLGNIVGKHHGKVVFTTQNKTTGAKKNITVTVTKTLTATYIKQTGADSIEIETDKCKLYEKDQTICSITLPTITASNGYSVIGWSKDKTSHTGVVTTMDISEDTNIYTIMQKDAITLSAKFYKNGANSLDNNTDEFITKTCVLEKTYNEEEQATTCSIATPTIEASTSTPNIVGYAESKDATDASVQPNISLTLSSNKTYYAITKSSVKTYTATFYKNGATSLDGDTSDYIIKQCNIPVTYNGASQATGCDITSPVIAASTATPTVIGYSKSDVDHNSIWASNETKIISESENYYAQTYKSAVTHTITWKANGSTIGSTASSCSLDATYNGVAQASGCSITSPSISRTGYTTIGWNTSESATTSAWDVGLTKVVSASSTYYAITKDTTAPTCGAWSGESTTWSNGTRTISVGCSDSGSGCSQSTYSQTFNSSLTTSYVSFTISDNAGNTNICSKTANIYLDKTAPEIPTFYRGYQLFGNAKNTSISYYNINAYPDGTSISTTSTTGDPQIVMQPYFSIKNAFGYIQYINPNNNRLLYQVFYNPTGIAASEENSAIRWISASNSLQREYLSFGKTMTFSANSSLIRVDIGSAAGLRYNLGGGFIIAEKNQAEPGNGNYLILSSGSTDTGGSGFSYLECNCNNNGYVKLTVKDSQNIYYLYDLPISGSTNGIVTYCRAVDNAGNKSGTTSIVIYTTG